MKGVVDNVFPVDGFDDIQFAGGGPIGGVDRRRRVIKMPLSGITVQPGIGFHFIQILIGPFILMAAVEPPGRPDPFGRGQLPFKDKEQALMIGIQIIEGLRGHAKGIEHHLVFPLLDE